MCKTLYDFKQGFVHAQYTSILVVCCQKTKNDGIL